MARADAGVLPPSERGRSWIRSGTRLKAGGHEFVVDLVPYGAPRDHDPRLDHSPINPFLPVNPRGDPAGDTLSYWPSYSRLDPRARWTYLDWIARGRSDPAIPIGYVFLFFYGLEQRLLVDDERDEAGEIFAEVRRLLPRFNRPASEALDDKLVATIRTVLADDGRPAYLDPAALEFLDQGRAAYRELGLDHRTLVPAGGDTHLVTWAGTAVNGLLAILLRSAGLEAEVHDVGITAVDTSPAELTAVLCRLEGCPPVEDLASFVEGLRTAKLDDFVDEDLLRRLWAVRHAKHRDRVTAVLRQITETRSA